MPAQALLGVEDLVAEEADHVLLGLTQLLVHPVTVLDQVAVSLEGAATLLALVRLVPCVAVGVLDELLVRDEALVAHSALVWLDPKVALHVQCQARPFGEGFATLQTL